MSLFKLGFPHSVQYESNQWINGEKIGEDDVLSVRTNLPGDTFRRNVEENAVIFEETQSDENDFKEVECGEPLHVQHLRINFNPIPGDDDDPDVEQKCLDFWKYIRSRPEIQHFMAVPQNISSSESETEKGDTIETDYTSSTLDTERELVPTAQIEKETPPSIAWMLKPEDPATLQVIPLNSQQKYLDLKLRRG